MSEININLLGEPALPLVAAVGRALHRTHGDGVETDERFTSSCLFATALLEWRQGANGARQQPETILIFS